MWILSMAAAGAVLAVGGAIASPVAVALVVLAFFLDCLDGEVARRSGATSLFGAFLEGFGQWLGGLAVLIGVAIGASVEPWLATTAVAASATFHLLFLLVPAALPSGGTPPAIRQVSASLVPFMPLDVNVVLAAHLAGRPAEGLVLWVSIVGVTTLVLVASLARQARPVRKQGEPSDARRQRP